MQIWTFSKHHIFKYDFWEKTQYSNMNFWCFLVTPGLNIIIVTCYGKSSEKVESEYEQVGQNMGEALTKCLTAQTSIVPSLIFLDSKSSKITDSFDGTFPQMF